MNIEIILKGHIRNDGELELDIGPGDIIFFDWADDGRDGKGDHVGIVEYVVNGKVHTIEGNSSDECRQREYDLDSLDILGYGTPMY